MGALPNDVLKICEQMNDFGKITSLLIKTMLRITKTNLENFFKMWCGSESIYELPKKMDTYFQAGHCELNILYFGPGEHLKELKTKIYQKYLLQDKEIARNEFLAKKVLTDLWTVMKEDLIISSDFEKSDFFKIIPSYVQQNIRDAHNNNERFDEQKFQYLSDYISGMTDRYAVFLWSQLFNPQNLRFI